MTLEIFTHAQLLLECFIIDTVAWDIPLRVHILHVPVKATELCQELGLVQVLLVIVHVLFDAWFFVEPSVCVLTCLVYRFTEHLVVLQPLLKLLKIVISFLGGASD